MYCTECGKESSDSDIFCSACGSRLKEDLGEVITEKKRQYNMTDKFIISILSLVAIGLIFTIVLVVQKNLPHAPQAKSGTVKGAIKKKAAKQTEIPQKIYRRNETIPYKSFLVTANAFGISDVLYDKENSMIESKPDSKDDTFLICDITVKNDGSSPGSFNESILGHDIYVEDSNGSKFGQSIILGFSDTLTDKVINPGSKVSGELFFELSKEIIKTGENKLYLVIGSDKFLISM